ncbi:kinetochore protein Spc25p [[Candida] anglica]|uniref:Kinetochore protein SPC25 n=1 Tax=[Candida] anglica TaxID=148631 RepID=A0ABP0EC33_9ASCO
MDMSAFAEYNVLQMEMEKFSAHFEEIMAKKRSEIINGKQQHYVTINDLSNRENQLNTEINNLRLKEVKVKETIKQSLENLQIQQLKVDELQSKKVDLVGKKEELQTYIDNLNSQIKLTSDTINKTETDLEEQNLRDYPELMKYESYLGLRIEVIAVDILKFIFTNIDPEDYDREIWCELAVGGDLYKIGKTYPELEESLIKTIENEFNDHREFVKFLKRIRVTLRDS